MHYEEKVIYGVLCYRNSPYEGWVQFTLKEMSHNYIILRSDFEVLLQRIQEGDKKEIERSEIESTVINRLQHLAIEKSLDMDGCTDIAEVYEKYFSTQKGE